MAFVIHNFQVYIDSEDAKEGCVVCYVWSGPVPNGEGGSIK